MNTLSSPVLLGLVLSMSVPLPAQGADPVPMFAVSQGHSGVRATGPGYRAQFDPAGVEYLPLAGSAAEPVRFTLTAVRRGAAVVWTRGQTDALPVVAGDRVTFRRGPDLTEVYDARDDGIEQSFVFATRPTGSGELVVCGEITTELPLASVDDDGVRYERTGQVGVTFGAVTGVDANGATARGSIRASGTHVEWVLPATFVDGAAYPLVLDPLIGTSFVVAPIGNAASRPAVAFAATQSRFLAVWRHTVSSTVAEVRAQFLGPTGTLLGSQLVLASADLVGSPAVAYVRATNRFLVVWAGQTNSVPLASGYVLMASISAAGGAPSPTVTVASGFLTQFDLPQVGGDSRPAGVANEYACITYRSSAGGQHIESRGVHVTATTNPILVGTAQVVTTGNVADLSMSKHAGSAGNWVAAWVHGTSSAGPYQHVSCRVIGAFGVPCSAVKALAIGVASADVKATACATSDGTDFVVAWEDAVFGKVRVRPCTFTGPCPGSIAAGLLSSPVVAAGTQRVPSIDFAKDKYVLAWLHDAAGSTTLYEKGLEPSTCHTCGAEHVLDNGTVNEPAVVSRWSGGDAASDEALTVWADGTIRGQRFEATGTGSVTAMGGACGSTGFDNFNTYNSSPVLGNLTFNLQLLAPTTPIYALAVGLSNVSIPCGPCTLVPSLDALVGGSTTVPLPLPCDLSYLGLQFYTQWVLYQPGGCSLFPDYALSNALQFTVAE